MGVTNLDFQGRPTQEIKLYPVYIISRKMSFYPVHISYGKFHYIQCT